MQHLDGLSLSDPETHRTVAEARALDADAVVAAVPSPHARSAAEADFARAAALGVAAFPTRPVVDAGTASVVARGRSAADEVDQHLAAPAAH